MGNRPTSTVPNYLNEERMKSPQLLVKFETYFISAVRTDRSSRIASSNHAQKLYVLG